MIKDVKKVILSIIKLMKANLFLKFYYHFYLK